MILQSLRVLWAVTIVASLGLVAWSTGRVLLARWQPSRTGNPLLTMHAPVCLGLGLLAYAIFASGLLGQLRAGTLGAIVALLTYIGRQPLRELFTSGRQRVTCTQGRWSLPARWLMGLLGVHAALQVLGALAAPTYWDSLVYHLGLPQLFVRQHHVWQHGGNDMICHPLLMQMLFGAGLAWRAELAAPLMNIAMEGLLALLVWQVARRWYDRTVALWAVALLCLTPLVNTIAAGAFVDLALAYVTAVAVWAWWEWEASSQRALLLISALCMGMALGIKTNGIVFALGLLARGCWRLAQHRQRLRDLCLWGVACLVLGAIWPLYRWRAVGAPWCAIQWAPMLGTVYTGVRFSWRWVWPLTIVGLRQLVLAMIRAGLQLGWIVLCPSAATDGWRFSPGPWPILWLGWLWALPRVDRRLQALLAWCVGAAALFAWLSFDLSRYITPLYPWLAIVSAYLLARVRTDISAALARGYQWLVVGVATLSILVLALQQSVRLPAALGLESREQFLTRRVEVYPVMQWANQMLPPESLVLTLDPRVYYLARPYLMGDPSYQHWLRWEDIPDAPTLLARLRARHITHVLVTESYMARWFRPPTLAAWHRLWTAAIAAHAVETIATHETSALYALRAP